MPRIWTATIESHRREVRAAIIDTTAALVGKDGFPKVTMSRIADEAGIGRATLYKYFRDVESILVAWHERHVEHHLRSLGEARDRHDDPDARLQAVLETYARITYERTHPHADRDRRSHQARARTRHAETEMKPSHGPHAGEIEALVHQTKHVADLQRRLLDLLLGVIREAARSGSVRDDIPPGELARFCLEALGAARELSSLAAVDRLVKVTLSGVRQRSR